TRAGGRIDHQRGGVDLAVNLEVQVEQVAALGGCRGLEHNLRARRLASLWLVPVGVNVQVGQVPVTQSDQMAERPKVGLQLGDWLPAAGDRHGQLRGLACGEVALHADVEAVDGGRG